MKNKIFPLLAMIVLSANMVQAQWCTPTTLIPYNANMPGITHFILNTIDRTSNDCENYPGNSYVNTGLSTNLIKGSTYNVTISYTIDATICPDMNLRVWIDYNKDGQLDDAGETVITSNNQSSLTYTGSFTVPYTATTGATRLRVTAKMTPTGGHSIPTPCDNPPDPIAYHGEMEDYTVDIAGPAGTESVDYSSEISVAPNPFSEQTEIQINYPSLLVETCKLFDILGNEIKSFDVTGNKITIRREKLPSGIYFYQLSNNSFEMVSGKLLVQ